MTFQISSWLTTRVPVNEDGPAHFDPRVLIGAENR